MEKDWYVYILECRDGTYYTGVTNDLDKRMKVHFKGKGSKYVCRKGFLRLLRTKKCEGKSDAFKCESFIKTLKRREKLGWFD